MTAEELDLRSDGCGLDVMRRSREDDGGYVEYGPYSSAGGFARVDVRAVHAWPDRARAAAFRPMQL